MRKEQRDTLISIIVPVYNVKPYLSRCLTSLVNQTHKAIEIILIDDGATDGSGELCDRWAEKDARIVVIHSPNGGVSHARNLGLRRASGDYIGFVDSDDWVDEDMYEAMLNHVLKMHSDIHIGGYIIENDKGSRFDLREGRIQTFDRGTALKQMITVSMRGYALFRGHLCDKLFKRSVLNGLYLDEDLKLREDTWLVWQAFRRAALISYAPQFSYHYWERSDSATHVGLKKENGTYLEAMRRIRDDSLDLDGETRSVVQEAYEAEVLFVLKDILLTGSTDFKEVFQQGQKELRTHVMEILMNSQFSAKRKLGMLCFCVPLWVLHMIEPLLAIYDIFKAKETVVGKCDSADMYTKEKRNGSTGKTYFDKNRGGKTIICNGVLLAA